MSDQWKCELCGAEKGEACRPTLARKDRKPTPLSLYGRLEHHARALPPGQSKQREKRNEAMF